MIGHELTIQQREPPDNEACNKPSQSDFGCITGPGKHALPTKSAADGKTIKAADQCFFACLIDRPAFHAMCMSAVMKLAKGVFNIRINPCFLPIAR